MTRYRSVRALARGLKLLRVFNEIGSASIQELASASLLHRTTVYRLLDTLKELGYVQENESDQTFRLTRLVKTLSSGFGDSDWVREVAYPILVELSKQVVWPVNLLVPFADTMMVIETTHHLSPFSIHRGLIGTRWPYMTTAYGRAFLAFCTDAERVELLNLLRHSSIVDNGRVSDSRYVRSIIRKTQEQGYGSTVDEAVVGNSSIAVPIPLEGRTLGCLNVLFFTSAMTPTEAATKYLSLLRNAADEIGAAARKIAPLGTVAALPVAPDANLKPVSSAPRRQRVSREDRPNMRRKVRL
jgi:IclR family mhp operon transcriptional activator